MRGGESIVRLDRARCLIPLHAPSDGLVGSPLPRRRERLRHASHGRADRVDRAQDEVRRREHHERAGRHLARCLVQDREADRTQRATREATLEAARQAGPRAVDARLSAWARAELDQRSALAGAGRGAPQRV